MDSRKYTLGKILNPWGGVIGFALAQVFIQGWATPLAVSCVLFTASIVFGLVLQASATDTRHQRYLQIKGAQQKQASESES